jgi:hypothetical protein
MIRFIADGGSPDVTVLRRTGRRNAPRMPA